MNDQDLESSKFYSYNFRNFSTMIILPAFIFVILLFIGSFFAVHENVMNSMGVITPDRVVTLENKEYKEGQKLSKGISVILADGKKGMLENNVIIHLDNKNSVAMPDIRDRKKLRVITYVPSSEVAVLDKGQRMKFNIENKQGTSEILNGKITNIGTYPVQQKKISMFEVETMVKTTKSERNFLRYGMQGKVSIITGRASYFNYIRSRVLNSK